MTHAKNERIAQNLRRLADKIEQSQDEYHSKFHAHGGIPKSATVYCVDASGAPVDFRPVCYSLLIGDEGFIRSMVVAEVSTGN